MRKRVIARRNSGFGDNLLQLANVWLYAKKHKKDVIPAWIASRYLRVLKNSVRINAFYYFFTLPSELEGVSFIKQRKVSLYVVFLLIKDYIFHILQRTFSKVSLIKLGAKTLNKKQNKVSDIVNDKLINNSYNLVVRECLGPHLINNQELKPFFNALQLRPDLMNKVNEFANAYFTGKKVVGVHLRYYPKYLIKSNHSPFWEDEEKALKKIDKALEKVQKELSYKDVIFLTTDSPFLQKYYLDKKIPQLMVYNVFNKNDRKIEKELHDSHMSMELVEASLIEMFLLAKCDTLVKNTGSWFHYYASLYVKNIVTIH